MALSLTRWHPITESSYAWEQDALVDVGLIELVANLPLQARRYDDAPAEVRMFADPILEAGHRV